MHDCSDDLEHVYIITAAYIKANEPVLEINHFVLHAWVEYCLVAG